ncbi:hypothetical protein [Coraliomargarita parva]|uniref:hypothetical protein n=1 Tax=Coraliomargarita parva TaxID=3014050 RepID=UPI0022B4B649|nr:hypothetical protein [Coraliomargarita parva]
MKKFFYFLSFLILIGAHLQGQETKIFLKAIEAEFQAVDLDHDSEGNSYVLGRKGTSTVIQKYDSAGLNTATLTSTAISNPIAMHVATVASVDYVYVSGTKNIVRFALNTITSGTVVNNSPEKYSISANSSYSDLTFRDLVYVSASGKIVAGGQNPLSRWPRFITIPANLTVTNHSTEVGVYALEALGVSGDGGSIVRGMTVDNLGTVYMVGKSSGTATSNPNRAYIAKFNPDNTFSVSTYPDLYDIYDVHFSNGWIYTIGQHLVFPSDLWVNRIDTGLGSSFNKKAIIRNGNYATNINASDTNKNRFSLTADASDNLYVTGYMVNGVTEFYSHGAYGADEEFTALASTSETGFVAKLNSDIEFDWVKAPIQSPFPSFGSHFRISWDAQNSRLWWAGSYYGGSGLIMQEGSDSSTALPLSGDTVSQGFVAVFEGDSSFTETVYLNVKTGYAENRVEINDEVIGDNDWSSNPILNSEITIRSPRTVYQVNPDGTPIAETDNEEADQNTIENSDRRYTFLNFSVNSVVQESGATVYTFALSDKTEVKLEWLVELALVVDSDFQNTASLAENPDGSLYVEPLTSKASGNPDPGVGKHWIEKDSPVVMQIDGAVEDLSSHPGLGIRYVPYGYTATGAFAAQVHASGLFDSVASRQQLAEFSMSAPTRITYDWKLQYGVSTTTSELSAEALMVVDFLSNPSGTVGPDQDDSEGAGTHWYDDGTTVRIGAPQTLNLTAGPKLLSGWLNGDNSIFSPIEDEFGTTVENPFSTEQLDAGFKTFTYNGETYIGLEVALSRPARVVWNYGDRIIFKTLTVGEFVQFTAGEIEDFSLLSTQLPSLQSNEVESGSEDVATASDYLWDTVAKRLFPLRPLEYDFNWPTESGNDAKVHLTVVWAAPNYIHIADTPGVSLIPHPPEGQPNDFVFKEIAYAEGDAIVSDQQEFTATETGRTVLEFSRITPSGRGGTAQSVVELRVVQTKLWNTGLGATVPQEIGKKVTSSSDKAGLGTGYVFFDKARFNPFIYDRSIFQGESLWDSSTPPGPVIPVNRYPGASASNEGLFVVVWYDDPTLNDHMLWPYQAEQFAPFWPGNSPRILMSSGYGSESVDALGNDQVIMPEMTVEEVVIPAATTFDPARFEQVAIYSQPNRDLPGYNPNEEHAIMAASLRYASVAPRPNAAYALRDSDLNDTSSGSTHTSEPYVLVQFLDKADNEFKMKVFNVVKEDELNYPDGFAVEMEAGEPVIPYYPLGVVMGATLSPNNYAKEGDTDKLVYWTDHKNTAWAVSGGGSFDAFFFYPLLPDFWWPDSTKSVGDFVAWLPNPTTDLGRDSFTEIDYTKPDQDPDAQGVNYSTVWPLDVAVLKVGETLTFSGGEYAADNADAPGLPGVLAWASGEVVYDDLNPDMREGAIDEDGKDFDTYTARMISALEERRVSLPVANFPEALRPATGRTDVDGTIYTFPELSSSLGKRIFYDPLTGELGIKGLINDKEIGDDTLTAAPPAVYVLEPNILTEVEYKELNGEGDNSPYADLSDHDYWPDAVQALYQLSRNPNGLSQVRIDDAGGYTAGLQVQDDVDPDTGEVIGVVDDAAQSYKALGPGLALVANPGFLDPTDDSLPDVSYVTLAENNDESLGGSPVILHIIKVDRRQRYRGAIKVVLSDNVFDENIILRHTGDFGANAEDLVFEWWYRVEDGTEALPPDAIPAGQTNPWKLFGDPSGNGGVGFYQMKLKGNPQAPELLLADSLWYVRYRHQLEEPSDPITWDATPEIPYEWAGAGNSTPNDLDGDGLPDYQAQLAQGWVKRVLDAVNPYEARIRDFTGDAPATYASMIRQFGQRYEGPVALNPDKNVIENVGLIELYGTILNRARSLSIDLSTPVSTPGITNALLLASTRLADFYMLLGNEAYTDAQNPLIGFGSDSVEYGFLAPTVFTFQNQLSTQMEEELALLRGVYDYKARPVYNRLFWNFTKGEGEAAYANSYNVSDVTEDGFIDEDDAMVLYPQGHGDAWGHYLTAIRGQYELLNHPYFNWVSRSELYSLQDIVFEVDFLDERKFAQVAAAKAKAGAEVVQLTYRDAYVADPESQWQGYIDTNTQRAWGVEGWARRAGQGAYFDWVTANALIPSEHPNSSYTGIRKVDRTTVKDIAVISANMNAVQQTFEDANNGYNPLGIAGNTVTFDIDPSQIADGTTHFEQIYGRATQALANAATLFDNASQYNKMLRNIENSEIDFRRNVFEEDMSYRNQLIEIFGTPYAGTIGSGKAYPAGYDGPDTALYMYVDQQTREITADTVPTYTDDFASALASYDPFTKRINVWSYDNNNYYLADYAPSFNTNSPSDWINSFNDVEYIVTGEDGITFDTDEARVKIENMDLPIKSSGYTFAAPDDWGDRASPGELQRHIASMIQQEAELAKAIAAWDGFQGGVLRQIRLIGAKMDLDSEVRGLMGGKIANNTILGALIIGFNTTANVMDDASGLIDDSAQAVKDFTPENLPTGGLAVSPGDALSVVRGAAKTGATAVEYVLKAVKTTFTTLSETAALAKDLIDMGLDFSIDINERTYALKEALVELENMVGDEGILRVEIFKQQEALREMSEEYRAMLQKGARLMDEREAYNKRVAELVQRNRYQDMSFRVARNAALQQYHEAFDLAARYTYLAAKAYDYETNLHPDDAGSAQGMLSDIVGERSLGYISYGTPYVGYGGLAEQLAQMKANFEVLKGQLGLNNPQTETGRFSLRRELFRITPDTGSDTAWRDELEAAKVANLWDMPEFRRYCRPFAAYDPENPEPGIVVEFSSSILSRKNFFGRNLAGGDNAYDPTNFATKVYSVGAWFEGYLNEGFETGLSETPRIYLVPVGSDVMMYPSDTELGVRIWDVLDQKIPVPYPVQETNLDDAAWRPLDTLGGTDGEIRKFSSFRAYHDSGYFDASEMTFDTRLVGRSVWNTRWLLIIPGSTLSADPDAGLQTFIDNITDIKLFFQTYGYSGN